MQSLPAISNGVSLWQSKAEDRLSSAIPTNNLLSYYDSRLLDDDVPLSEGLLLNLNIPLASWQTVFTLFDKRNIFLCFCWRPSAALIDNIEAPFLSSSENIFESVVSAKQFEHCLSSFKYQICFKRFSTEIRHSSCIATLSFLNNNDALTVCETSVISLTSIEQATISRFQYLAYHLCLRWFHFSWISSFDIIDYFTIVFSL